MNTAESKKKVRRSIQMILRSISSIKQEFGSGIRKIYSLCNAAGVEIKYEKADTDFKIEFSRIDRNKSPLSGHENGRINDHISDLEQAVLSCLREEPGMTNAELLF